jgi:homeobox-leucine zipper protein
VEHVEIEDKTLTHRLYRDLSHSGLAFGAERWLAVLRRICERFACLMVTGTSTTRDLGGGNLNSMPMMLNFISLLLILLFTCICILLPVIPSPDGKRSMMKLAQRMVNNFCASISTSIGHRWTSLSGLNEVGVRVTVHKSTDPGQPNGVVLSAATTIWLPISPQNVFNFFKDERTRAQV